MVLFFTTFLCELAGNQFRCKFEAQPISIVSTCLTSFLLHFCRHVLSYVTGMVGGGGSLFVYGSMILDGVNNTHTEEETNNVHQNTNKEMGAQKLECQNTSREFHSCLNRAHLSSYLLQTDLTLSDSNCFNIKVLK
jgi:hypothetical protein